MKVINPQNHRVSLAPFMRSVIYSLVREYGLPEKVQRTVGNAEQIIELSNVLYRAYVDQSRHLHTVMGHPNPYFRCKDEACTESHKLITNWSTGKRNHRRGLALIRKYIKE